MLTPPVRDLGTQATRDTEQATEMSAAGQEIYRSGVGRRVDAYHVLPVPALDQVGRHPDTA